MAQQQNGSYAFGAEPRAVQPHGRKAKYRDYAEDTGNIMYDPRVVRGSTHGRSVAAKEPGTTRRRGRRGGRNRGPGRGQSMSGDVDPVPGRKHIDVQTDDYLEELTDKLPEKDQETQTDLLMDQPPEPLFMPAKIGVDQDTQIEPGDLFDFDIEVEPILEVLVGKTLEQAMDEVLEEEELKNIREHKARFQQQRNVELAELQRLEAETKRRAAEKERRVKQEKARVAAEEEVMEKVAARGFAKSFLSDLHTSVFENLVDSGHFYDPVQQEVEETFLPWLTDMVVAKLDKVALSRQLADSLILASLAKCEAIADAAEKKREQEKAQAEAAAFLQAQAAAAAELPEGGEEEA